MARLDGSSRHLQSFIARLRAPVGIIQPDHIASELALSARLGVKALESCRVTSDPGGHGQQGPNEGC
jgi:hypothetical protein